MDVPEVSLSSLDAQDQRSKDPYVESRYPDIVPEVQDIIPERDGLMPRIEPQTPHEGRVVITHRFIFTKDLLSAREAAQLISEELLGRYSEDSGAQTYDEDCPETWLLAAIRSAEGAHPHPLVLVAWNAQAQYAGIELSSLLPGYTKHVRHPHLSKLPDFTGSRLASFHPDTAQIWLPQNPNGFLTELARCIHKRYGYLKHKDGRLYFEIPIHYPDLQ